MASPNNPLMQDFEQRSVMNLLEAVRYLNVLTLLTRVNDPAARLWLHATLTSMAMLYKPQEAQQNVESTGTPGS